MNNGKISLLAVCVGLAASSICNAAAITFYEYDTVSSTSAPALGPSVGSAFLNYNWGQNMNSTSSMGPIGGSSTGPQPAAYSIWKVTAPVDQLLTSITVFTRAKLDRDTTGLGYNNLAYVDYSLSPSGSWTKLYSHDFNKTAWTPDDQTGTISLSEPVAEMYIRIAATKYATNYYWYGDYKVDDVVVGQQSNLRFSDLKITGETASVPEASSLGLLGAAVLLAAKKKR